jgi:hypothetical protein
MQSPFKLWLKFRDPFEVKVKFLEPQPINFEPSSALPVNLLQIFGKVSSGRSILPGEAASPTDV